MALRALCGGLGLLVLAPLLRAVEPPPPRLSAAEGEALVRDVGAAVERLRGLKFKTPVKMEVIDGNAARASFKSKIEPGTEEELRHTQAVYAHLGLISKKANLLAGYLDLAEKGVLGYYEPGSKVFYLLDHVARDEVRGVIAHELTHALEDQHFDLQAVAAIAEGDPDRSTAITSLVEGSAMAVMLAYQGEQQHNRQRAREDLEKGEVARAQRLKAAPSFTQRTLMMPYALGFSFLLHGKPWEWLYEGVKLSDIDKAYAKPPRSTRQILHPEQYWRGREPRPAAGLDLPDLAASLGPGWKRAATGSIGELGLAVLTGAQLDLESPLILMPDQWTNRAAAGSLGDVYQHYVKGEQRVTLLLTQWENELEREEFENALEGRGPRRFRYGTNVVLLAGDYGDRADALALAAIQRVKYWTAE